MKKLSKKLPGLIAALMMLIFTLPNNFAFATKLDEPLSEIPAAKTAVANAFDCTMTGEGKLIILCAVVGLLISGVLVAVVVYKKKKSYTDATEEK